jgi:hypothetical protein
MTYTLRHNDLDQAQGMATALSQINCSKWLDGNTSCLTEVQDTLTILHQINVPPVLPA